MNKIWVGIIIFCLAFGIISGNVDQMVNHILNVPYKTLEIVIKMGGLIVFYSGLFQIAIDSGLIKATTKLFKPLIRKLFPKLSPNSIANEYICANLVANLLGLGIAATPMALKAFTELKKENNNQDKVSSSMVILMLLNITSFCLFPMTVISARKVYGAKINVELIPMMILISFCLTVISIIIYRVVGKKDE